MKTQETFSLYLFIIYLFKDKIKEIVESAYEVVDKPRKSILFYYLTLLQFLLAQKMSFCLKNVKLT